MRADAEAPGRGPAGRPVRPPRASRRAAAVTTVGALLERRAAEDGDRPFLVMDGARLTFAELEREANRRAHALAARGVERGDRVALVLPNSPDFLLLSSALRKLGAVEVAVNTELRGRGLAHVLSVSRPALVVADPALATLAELASLPLASAAELVSDRDEPPRIDVRPSDPAAVLFTSGTTGAAKGCVLSHRYFLRQAELIADALRLSRDDCLYCPFPLYHADAAVLTVGPALVLGARAAIGRRFSVSRFWDEVRAFGATVFDYMGATLTLLWRQEPRPDDADNPARLAWGSPLPPFHREFGERFGLEIVTGYGSTDAGIPCWQSPGEQLPDGSCGRARHPYELRVVDEWDNPVPPGEVGEIVVRPHEPDVTMTEYLGMPEATLETFRNLWLHTGDLGRLDKRGYLYFAGRQKDAIRRRGENISAWEIEEVVSSHPAVAECAAVGVPSELTEEDVKVFVVLEPGSALDADGLREFCRSRMARFMVPDHVELVDEIPKTGTGKPEKYKLARRP